jgi:hypothetical protein
MQKGLTETQDFGDEIIFLRIDALNLRFLKGEIYRDRLNDYRGALKIFQDLEKTARGKTYYSIHPMDNAFEKPATTAARSDIALTLMRMGKKKKACSLWLHIALEEGKKKIKGAEQDQSYCQHSLMEIQKFCGDYGEKLLKDQSQTLQHAPQDCQELWSQWSDAKETKMF